MATASTDVAPTPFETLTETQQAIIDELARERVDDLDRTYAEIVTDAVERHGVEEFDISNITKIKQRFGDLIEERADVLLNGHDRVEAGNVTIEGSIDLTDEERFPKPQTFAERPITQTVAADESDETVTLEVTRETLFGIIDGSLPVEERRAIFEAVMAE